jgi:peptide/nickel transport system permease protein
MIEPALTPMSESEAVAMAVTPRTYWGIVVAQFLKNRAAVFGLCLVITLMLIAVFVPLLASSLPFYIRQNGVTRFPLLRSLTREDLTIFSAAWAFGLWLVSLRFIRTWRFGAFLIAAAITVALSMLIQATVHEYNDRTDYRSLAAKPGVSALFAPIRYSPQETNLFDKRQPPFRLPGHYLGTDDLGRDVFSRLLWSARVSLAVGFVAEGVAVLIGVVLGALAGYFGRRTDFVVMRLVEITMCFPSFFLILTILAFFGRSLWLIMVVIGLVGWTDNARFIRGEFLRLRTMEYAMAARALGLGAGRVIFRHLLPNGIAPVMVNTSFGIAGAILVEGGLSFLGFGVPPPTPTWGTMLNDGQINPLAMPWMILLPGFAIFMAVAAYNLVGEGLRDALDPRLKSA